MEALMEKSSGEQHSQGIKQSVYFDCNSTTPLIAQASEAAIAALTRRYANPSSVHWEGCLAMEMRETARSRAATLIGCSPDEVVFTSGATESIHTAIFSALWEAAELFRQNRVLDRRALLYGATEHKVVPEALRHWVRILGLPFEVKAIPVDRNGQYSMRFLSAEIGRAYLICTMAVNNETGVIQQLDTIARSINGESSPPLWLVDGVQALGKVATGFQTRPISYLALSGHKLHAPKGIGVLVARRTAPYHPLFVGGGQEQGRRSGTEPLPALAGLSEVLRILLLKNQKQASEVASQTDAGGFADNGELENYRNQIVSALEAAFPGLSLNADPENCVPTTINFSVPGMSGVEVWLLLESQGVFVSSGSACQSSKQGFSHVLEAMGLELWRLASATRLSFGLTCKESDVQMGCGLISSAGQALRRSFGQSQSIIRVTNGIRTALVFLDKARQQAAFIGPVNDFSLRVGTLFSEVSQSTSKRIALDAVYDCSGSQTFLTSGSDSGVAQFAHEQQWRWQGNSGNESRRGSASDWSFKNLSDGFLLCTPVSNGNVQGSIAGIAVFARRELVRQQNLALLDKSCSYIGVCCDEGRDSAGGIPFYISDGKVVFVTDLSAFGQTAFPGAEGIDQTLEAVRKMGPDIRYIDVRERYEHVQQSPFAQVPDAIPGMFGLTQEVERVPLSEMIHFLFSEANSGEAKDGPIVFMCRTGKRGFNAAALMRLFGWPLAFNLKGGAATIQTELDSRRVS
jgi:cysteine sulfinate desulfinase/cysteine desulfurase-like protein/rhodanese-related sulfurtransferase